MATYEDAIIKPAYVAVNVIQDTSESISTTLRDNAVVVLNQLLSSNSAERLMGYNVVHQTGLTISAGTAKYTFGTGGTLVATSRPVAITGWDSASGNFSVGGEPISFDALRAKKQNPTARRSVLPEVLAADQAYPSINIELFPVPDTSPGSLTLDYWSVLTAVAYGDTVTVPDGWERYMVLGLARELGVRYPIEGGRPELERNWMEAKTAITARVAAILGGGTPPAAA
jgi:hypothetical protein